MRLAGKRAVVTGAAGGIGAAVAQAFLREGAVVGGLDLTAPPAGVTPLIADVRDEQAVSTAMTAFATEAGGIDVLACCAAIQLHGQDGPADRLDLAVWQRTIDVNLTGLFLTVKHALSWMRAASNGSIIVCGSPTGVTMTGAGYDAYSASKGGVMALARALAGDLAADGIRVNTVVPGPIETRLIASLIDDGDVRRALVAGVPLGRLGSPDDVVGAFVYLACDESRYATGSTLTVDGGVTAR